jgi:hypothetical protein
MIDEKEKGEIKTGGLLIDVGKMYKFDPENLSVDIVSRNYSNHVFIQGTDNDMYIDFLEFPGVMKEGQKGVVPGIRVYMSHIAAQRMALAVLGLLNKMHDEGKITQFKPEKDLKKVGTTITRATDSDKI